MMKVESLACNNCGAPLNVPESANFVTCAHCGSGLAVRRDPSVHYTEALDRIEQHTGRISEDIQVIRLQNDLEQLDRDWERRRRRYYIRLRDGRYIAPTMGYVITSILITVGVALFTIVWFASSFQSQAGGGAQFFGWIGVLLVAVAVVNVVTSYTRVSRYRRAVQAYTSRREEIIRLMNA